jgi:hypothetical protein
MFVSPFHTEIEPTPSDELLALTCLIRAAHFDKLDPRKYFIEHSSAVREASPGGSTIGTARFRV